MGLFDLEVNCLTKILFGALVVVSLVMVALQHFAGRWYLQIFRFLLLLSHIVPIRCEHLLSLSLFKVFKSKHSFTVFSLHAVCVSIWTWGRWFSAG